MELKLYIMFRLTVRTLNRLLELLNLEKPKNAPVPYIYTTDAEVQEDFGPNATVSVPFL